ncbi:MAG: DNA repair protein RadA [Bacteroidetes bacterium]|nr:DNA repair protein RadA [Bacteroidota bacterium]
MSKVKTLFVCQSCGYQASKYLGKCPECDKWNSFVEESASDESGSAKHHDQVIRNLKKIDSSTYVDLSESAQRLEEIQFQADHRTPTGILEFDRVLGGGLVKGSLVLVGGEPGIGKSTLMLQMAAHLKGDVLYVSGEESVYQIKSRAERLAASKVNMKILAETNLEKILQTILREKPQVVVVDSVQTLYREEIQSAPGSVSQVRECAALLMHLTKSQHISVFLVGHVTKDGTLAGPKVLEHMVDTVLQFEGDQHHLFRILRATKNRFGSTNEIGIFEMQDKGLIEITNPSELFLSERDVHHSGSVVVPVLEGSRVLLVEVQALASTTSYGMPQRTTSGFDLRRLQLLIAVLEKRARLPLGSSDIFLNIAGGLHVEEPAIDLGVALAISSSYQEKPMDPHTVVLGELGLGGEVRAVSHAERRVREAVKLGFNRVILPKGNLKDLPSMTGVTLVGIRRIDEAMF